MNASEKCRPTTDLVSPGGMHGDVQGGEARISILTIPHTRYTDRPDEYEATKPVRDSYKRGAKDSIMMCQISGCRSCQKSLVTPTP